MNDTITKLHFVIMTLNRAMSKINVLLTQHNEDNVDEHWQIPSITLDNRDEEQRVVKDIIENISTNPEETHTVNIYEYQTTEKDITTTHLTYLVILPNDNTKHKLAPETLKATDTDKDKDLWFTVSYNNEILLLFNTLRQITVLRQFAKRKAKSDMSTAGLTVNAITYLQEHVNDTDIAFHFIPTTFTLPDCQRVFELILNTEFDEKDFKTEISPKITPLRSKTTSVIKKDFLQAYKKK